MWQQVYLPVADNLALSALVAAIPIIVLLLMIGVLRKPPWAAAMAGLGTSVVVAIGVYGMPASLAASSVTYGAAFGLFPICWIVFWAITLYRLTLGQSQFAIVARIHRLERGQRRRGGLANPAQGNGGPEPDLQVSLQ